MNGDHKCYVWTVVSISAAIAAVLCTLMVCITYYNIQWESLRFNNGYQQEVRPGSQTPIWVKASEGKDDSPKPASN